MPRTALENLKLQAAASKSGFSLALFSRPTDHPKKSASDCFRSGQGKYIKGLYSLALKDFDEALTLYTAENGHSDCSISCYDCYIEIANCYVTLVKQDRSAAIAEAAAAHSAASPRVERIGNPLLLGIAKSTFEKAQSIRARLQAELDKRDTAATALEAEIREFSGPARVLFSPDSHPEAVTHYRKAS